MNSEEYNELQNRIKRVDAGGCDGADIYDCEAFAKHLEEKYSKPIKQLETEYKSKKHSMKIPPPGDYIAKLNGRIVVYEAPSGSLCAAVPCILSQGEHAGFTTKITVLIVKKDGTLQANSIDNLKSVFGWDGIDPFALMDSDYADIEFTLADCKHEEYEGNMGFKPSWLNPLGGGQKMPEPADRKSVLAKYGSKFRALAGGTTAKPGTPAKPSAKPPATPTKKTPPPAPTGPTATMEECWDEFCKANPTVSEEGMPDLWFKTLKEKFGTDNNSEITPHQWGAFKATLADNLPM